MTEERHTLAAIIVPFYNTLTVELSADKRCYSSDCNLQISCNKLGYYQFFYIIHLRLLQTLLVSDRPNYLN